MMVLDPQLLSAFRRTRYEVELDGRRHVLRVGEVPPCEVEARVGGEAAFLTACNPGGRRLPPAANARRMAALDERLAALGWRRWPATHRAEDPAWDEESRLVRFSDLAQLDELANAFGQAAVLLLRPKQPTRLRCYGSFEPAPDLEQGELRSLADAPALAEERPLLRVEKLCGERGGERIFGPIDLCLRPGELYLVEGPNGSGKTTLLRTLAGLGTASDEEGEQAPRIERFGAMAYLGHQLGLRGELSAMANLAYARALANAPGLTPAMALAAVGLAGWEDRPLATLSAGQRKRAALARLLVAPAALWLLDEPYANLDREGCELLNRMLETQLARGGGIILTSHGTVPWRGAARRLRL